MDARVSGTSHALTEPDTTAFRIKPDGSLDPIGETGWFLQREREKRGESLEQASEATGIHASHLHAIETGDLRGMPHREEALQMVGLYALHMGFEPEPLMAHYAQFMPVMPVLSHPADPAPCSSAKVIKFGKGWNLFGRKLGVGTTGIVASCLGAVLLFAGANWLMSPAPDMVPVEELAQSEAADPMPTASVEPSIELQEEDMPDDNHASSAVLPGGQSAVGVEPGADAAGERSLDGLTALIEKTVGATPEATDEAAPIPVPVVASPEPPTPAATNGKSRLVLKAKSPVWIRIQDGQGSVVVTKMLMPGDNYRVPDQEGLVVIARDGGLLLYEIDGKDHGILGTPGEILVGRSLDLKTLEKRG
jgi:cytoskeleton protein RodZ